MRILRTFFVFSFVGLISSCSFVPAAAIRADPLEPARLCATPKNEAKDKTKDKAEPQTQCTTGSARSRAFQLMQDSLEKCQAFLVELFDSQAKTSTGLDIASTTFSALVPVFSRVGIKNTLGAGSAIATGSKNSIRTEYLNSLALANVTQAVNQTYFVEIAKYRDVLDAKAPESIDVDEVRVDLLRIHALCSLTSAEGTIQANFAPSASTSAREGVNQLTFVYTVMSGDTQANLVANVVKAFNADPGFKAADIQAQVDKANPATQIDFISPNATWQSIHWMPVSIVVPTRDEGAQPEDPKFKADFANDVATLTFNFTGNPVANTQITLETDSLVPKAVQSALAKPTDLAKGRSTPENSYNEPKALLIAHPTEALSKRVNIAIPGSPTH